MQYACLDLRSTGSSSDAAELAFEPEHADDGGVAIARYEGAPGPGIAEMAVAVKSAWRSLGLASILVDRLQVAAHQQEITVRRADFLAEKEAARALRRLSRA